MSNVEKNTNQTCLKIARLGLSLETKSTGLKIVLPQSYEHFVEPVNTSQALSLLKNSRDKFLVDCDFLMLEIYTKQRLAKSSFSEITPIFKSDNWEIKFDNQGNFILEALRIPPNRRITINPDFSNGEVQGKFLDRHPDGFYPLQDLDMKVFVNWLARYSDIILHASGVMLDGKGYAFAGQAGAGKSTLAAALNENPAVTILGEDQVILRYLDDRFWIFGTPWHENPAMCSQHGTPLEKLFFLDRNLQPGTSAIKPIEGFTRILQTAFIPYYRQDLLPGILDRLERLSKRVPSFLFSYMLGTDPFSQIIQASVS